MSLRARLLLSTIALVAISILIMGLISVNVAVNNATQALTESAQEKLISQNVQTREAVDEYFGFIESQIRTKAFSIDIIDATSAFVPAYRQYSQQRGNVSPSEIEQVKSYYNNEFLVRYNELNIEKLSSVDNLYTGLSENGMALQHDFIGGSDYPLGEKDALITPNNTSDYAKIHQKHHPSIRGYLQEFGYYDIFIADINTGNIIYSVFKELDYATSLRNGPYSDTGIGKAFEMAANASEAGQVFFTDFASYRPSYDALAGFASTPIYVDGRKEAVLIFQMPMDHLNGLLTHGNKWSDSGFGASGETYLINAAGVLVTESRFFVEDYENYVNAIKGKYPVQTQKIQSRGTSIGIQPVESQSSKLALKGKEGFMIVRDYRDVEVFSAYSPVKIGDQQLALVAEIDVEEALGAATELRNVLIQSAIIEMLVLVAFAACVTWYIANRIVAPLKRLGEACEGLTTGEGDLTIRLSRSRIPEINRITNSFNTFIGQIRDIIDQMKSDSDALAGAAQELSAVTSQSKAVSNEQLQQAGLVASAMEQLSSSISNVAHSTEETARKGLQAQQSLNENMERADMAATNIKLLVSLINDSSVVISSLKNEVNQITSVLNVITSIADQTNLLALNAAIEAARAGEAGRGFSVVADEVRALATRSQESTVEISKLIDVMNQSSQKSVDRMERAAAAADGGIHLVDLVTVAMDELAATLDSVLTLSDAVSIATSDQNATSDSVVSNINKINEMSQDVSDGASQTSNAADEMAKMAEHSRELVSRFKVS